MRFLTYARLALPLPAALRAKPLTFAERAFEAHIGGSQERVALARTSL